WGRMIAADEVSGAGYSFDDIELYAVSDDIQVLGLVSPAAESCGLGAQESVTIKIRNSSAQALTDIPVFYQLSDGTIVSETIPSLAKRTTVDYTFQAKANLSALGSQTVKVWSALATDSFRDNDTLLLTLFNAPVITAFPYLENFENNSGYWFAKGIKSSWQHGTPASPAVQTAASGSKIWKTNLAGWHNDKEESYLYSPCFKVDGMAAPTLSFSVALDLEYCDPNPCDIVYLEYSGNGGAWTRLGAAGQGTNWYDRTYSGKGAWSKESDLRWRVASIALPTGFTDLKIRFVMVSDGFTSREGIALDDIHIYDKLNAIYDEGTMVAAAEQNVAGGNVWIHFTQNGKLIASVYPNGQNLGNTQVQSYLSSGAVRSANLNYYLDRNLSIKPANGTLQDSVGVRIYFSDDEVKTLIAASGCESCDKPEHAYQLALSKYRNADTSKEDGTLANNSDGGWSFHDGTEVRIVPFDKGYYAEFKVKNFSEFWLAKGFIGNSSSLPVDLISFNARKKGGVERNNDVIVEWETASEEDFDRFEIEVASGNEAYRKGMFARIGQITGRGNEAGGNRYSFNDQTNVKTGVRYYRLKMVDTDSSFKYSSVRPVVFDEKIEWGIYPNPSSGVFQVMYQADPGKAVTFNLYDLTGRLFRKASTEANGFPQKEMIDLSATAFPRGIYLLEVANGKDKQVFKLLKE
uniref:T9SS type A sorting domain-containing protein n=1 Tax=Dyadobacter sp. TaxID=1914288 RepID=UPI003F6F205E